jgi:hypothetical protein
LGWNTPQNVHSKSNDDLEDGHEGNIHSGPGGYEGMGYSGGYAAEYRQVSDMDLDEFDEGEH